MAAPPTLTAPSHPSGELPPGTPAWITPELLAATHKAWQSYFPKALTPQDALAILMTVGQLFDVLEEPQDASVSTPPDAPHRR